MDHTRQVMCGSQAAVALLVPSVSGSGARKGKNVPACQTSLFHLASFPWQSVFYSSVYNYSRSFIWLLAT